MEMLKQCESFMVSVILLFASLFNETVLWVFCFVFIFVFASELYLSLEGKSFYFWAGKPHFVFKEAEFPSGFICRVHLV